MSENKIERYKALYKIAIEETDDHKADKAAGEMKQIFMSMTNEERDQVNAYLASILTKKVPDAQV